MTIFNLPRDQRSPETEVDVLLSNLSVIYSERHPDDLPYDLINIYFKDFYESDSPGQFSGDFLAGFNLGLYETKVNGVGKTSIDAAMIIACAYCVEALKAWDDGRINEAWTLIIDARTWANIPMSAHPFVDKYKVIEHKGVVSEYRREARKKGVEAYDYSDFIEQMYKSRPWPNKTTAARVIADALPGHIESNKLPIRTLKSEDKRTFVKQEDFYAYVFKKLPKGIQVKRDAAKFIS